MFYENIVFIYVMPLEEGKGKNISHTINPLPPLVGIKQRNV
jgi:hypothetical protein